MTAGPTSLFASLALAAVASSGGCGGGRAHYHSSGSDAAPDADMEPEPPTTWLWHLGSERSRRFGSGAVEMDDGGIALVGFADPSPLGASDPWVLRISPAGEVLWEMIVGGPDHEAATAAAPHPDGGLVLAGGSASCERAWPWLLHLDADGRVVWQRTFGGEEPRFAAGVVPAVGGGFVVVATASFEEGRSEGVWVAHVGDDGRPVWQREFYGVPADSAAAAALQDGGSAVAGTEPPGGGDQTWIARLGANGEPAWQRLVSTGTGGHLYRFGLSETARGDIVLVAGRVVVRFDAEGVVRWQRRVSGGLGLFLSDVLPGEDDGVVIIGTEQGLAAQPFNLWVVAFDAEGEVRWQRSAPRMEALSGHDAVLTRDRAMVAVAGGSSDTIVLKIGLDAHFGERCSGLQSTAASAAESDVTVEPHDARTEEVFLEPWNTTPQIGPSSTTVEVVCGS